MLRHDLFTNSVLYAELALDMTGVPMHLIPLIPLFCRCLTQMGTAQESFVELTARIGRKTGGVSVSPFVSEVRGRADPAAFVVVRWKAMGDKAGELTGEGVGGDGWGGGVHVRGKAMGDKAGELTGEGWAGV